jgi:hypothetical protein
VGCEEGERERVQSYYVKVKALYGLPEFVKYGEE